MEQNITLDPAKLSVVLIDKIRPNTWNPKDKDTEEYKKIIESIKLKGQRQAIIVRENNGFEIIDGEQRWRACKELGFEKVIVYNEGVMDDKSAQELTLWYQVQVPFNEIALAQMVVKMVTDFNDANTPYPPEKIEEMKELIKFDWDKYKTGTMPPNEVGVEIKTLVVPMTNEQYKIIQDAFQKVRSESDGEISDARCIELICADYLAGE
jgi:hypothetical protein